MTDTESRGHTEAWHAYPRTHVRARRDLPILRERPTNRVLHCQKRTFTIYAWHLHDCTVTGGMDDIWLIVINKGLVWHHATWHCAVADRCTLVDEGSRVVHVNMLNWSYDDSTPAWHSSSALWSKFLHIWTRLSVFLNYCLCKNLRTHVEAMTRNAGLFYVTGLFSKWRGERPRIAIGHQAYASTTMDMGSNGWRGGGAGVIRKIKIKCFWNFERTDLYIYIEFWILLFLRNEHSDFPRIRVYVRVFAPRPTPLTHIISTPSQHILPHSRASQVQGPTSCQNTLTSLFTSLHDTRNHGSLRFFPFRDCGHGWNVERRSRTGDRRPVQGWNGSRRQVQPAHCSF